MRTVDRVLGWLLILGGVGHTVGSLQAYKADPMQLLWTLSASVLVWVLGAVNLLRAERDGDWALAWICLCGNLAWMGLSLRFGALIGNVFDFRPMIFVVLLLGLCGFCVRTLTREARDRAHPS